MSAPTPAVSRIGAWLPDYDAREIHSIEVRAPARMVDDLLQDVDFGRSAVIRTLCRLRGLPPDITTLGGMPRMGFVTLEHRPGVERLHGLIGRFWTVRGDIVRFEPDAFPAFDRPGYARAAWSFVCEDAPDGRTRLTTETRVRCTDASARRSFLRYWRLIGPFSAWIRLRMLAQARTQIEASIGVTSGRA